MRCQGRITVWKDDRGFGFISPDGGGEQVFVHATAFPARRRPVGGERVTYQVKADARGRRQAERVAFVGDRSGASLLPAANTVSLVVALLFVVAVAITVLAGQLRMDALPLDLGVPRRYEEPSRFPAMRRDLALVVPAERTQEELRGWIREAAGDRLEAIELFDHYRGKHIPSGHVGLGFSLTFRAVDGDLWVEHLLTSLPGGVVGFLVFVNLLVFLLAFFLDFFEISFIILPLLAPVAEKLGIDLVWFGVLLAVNMQTSFMHPPFGFALFYLRSVAPPQVKTTQIYRGAIPFLGIQLLMVALIIAFPGLVRSPLGVPVAAAAAPIEVVAPPTQARSLLDSPDFGDLLERQRALDTSGGPR